MPAAAPDRAVAVREEEPRAIVVIRDQLEKRASDLLAVLPPGMDHQRFMRVSLLAISKNPDLLACTPLSLIRSIVEAAEIGLEPTGSLNRAWLVPYSGEAQLMIGYQGYADLMRDTGAVRRIRSEVVYGGDHFKVVKGSTPRIEHEPAFATEDPTKITHVYAIVEFADGGEQAEVMTRDQVEAVRAKSKQRNGATWTQNWPQMARKTVIRRVANYVPLSTKAQTAIALDDEREFGQPTVVEPTETRTASVRERVRARRKPATPKNAPGAPEEPKTPDTPAATEPAQQQPAAAVQQPENEGAAVSCGAPSPFGEGVLCDLERQHPGMHQSGQNESWPR